ncbi:hypothetical protein O181_050411 [Austropuccinia psidii MF-1]|uniref:Uncharacterized protein n=1 Tax=Austropuccinia psidii MF-1 TaxID=1389203 RepID=A0A9Q3E1R8_9BASI|nr:hypothetical protein [Austropuccinia psidii MF-1]
MESYSHLPQLSNGQPDLSKIQDEQLIKAKQIRGEGYTAGNSCTAQVVIENKPTKPLLGPGAFRSCIGKYFLKPCVPNFEDQLLPIDGIKFNSACHPMQALVIFETNVIFPQRNGNSRITVEFFLWKTALVPILYWGMIKRKIIVKRVSSVNLELETFKYEHLNEAEISLHLTDKQENELYSLLCDHKEAFESVKEPLQAVVGHEADILFNIQRCYPPLLKISEYPASPESREALEIYIKELLDLGVIRNIGHNEEVEITKPVIVACHDGKFRMVGDFRALNT